MTLSIIHQFQGEDVIVRALSGVVGEDLYPEILDPQRASALVLDLSRVSGVSPQGARRWTEALRTLCKSLPELVFVEASPRATSQFNRVVGFDGGGTLLSFYALIGCGHCGEQSFQHFDALTDRAIFDDASSARAQCQMCGRAAELLETPEQLFDYVRRAPTTRISDSAQRALLQPESQVPVVPGLRPTTRTALLDQRVRHSISGNIDPAFNGDALVRKSRQVNDVELWLTFVQQVDELAVAGWAEMLDHLLSRSRVHLHACPPVFLRRMVEEPRFLGNAAISSLLWPMHCRACGGRQMARIEVDGVLSTERPPCAICGRSELDNGGRAEDFEEVSGWIADNNDIEPSLRTRVERSPLFGTISRYIDRTVVADAATAFATAPSTVDAPAESLAPAEGQYRILAGIGEGPTGPVSLVVQQGAGGFRRLLTVKSLRSDYIHDEEMVRVFLEEARIGAFLDAPNLMRVHDVGRNERSFFMVLDFVHGERLNDALEMAAGGVPLVVGLEIARQVAAALASVHAANPGGRGLIHRDVCPARISVGFDGRIRLGDFSVAAQERLLGSDARQGLLYGTLAYMAPELVRGAEGTPASDIWSLGVVLLELLTGKNPFAASSPEASASIILRAETDFKALGVPRAVRRVLRKCMAPTPAARFGSALELEAELSTLCSRAKARRMPSNRLPGEVGAWLARLFSHQVSIEDLFTRAQSAANLYDALLSAPLDDVERFVREWRGVQIDRASLPGPARGTLL